MSSKHLLGDTNYAWPTAEIAVMGAKVKTSSRTFLCPGTLLIGSLCGWKCREARSGVKGIGSKAWKVPFLASPPPVSPKVGTLIYIFMAEERMALGRTQGRKERGESAEFTFRTAFVTLSSHLLGCPEPPLSAH